MPLYNIRLFASHSHEIIMEGENGNLMYPFSYNSISLHVTIAL